MKLLKKIQLIFKKHFKEGGIVGPAEGEGTMQTSICMSCGKSFGEVVKFYPGEYLACKECTEHLKKIEQVGKDLNVI